jgi:hypothetical protein
LKPEAIRHIAYELWGLVASHRLLNSPPINPLVQCCEFIKLQRDAIFNAAFDEFLVHYRNLAHFFEFEGARLQDDEVRASHYCKWTRPGASETPKWAEGRKSESKNVNKLLAHLTYDRCRVKVGLDHRKDFPGMLKETRDAWQRFYALLSDADKGLFAAKLRDREVDESLNAL